MKKIKQSPNTKCVICGKKFYAKPCFLKRGWGKYCSLKCLYAGQRKGKFIYCDICGKKIWRKPLQLKRSKSGKFFCSKSCQTLWRNREFSGSRHANWKGGEHIRRKKFLIKNKIKKPICKLCGCEDVRILAVHHFDKNRKNNDLDNLIWLCHNCHHLVHRYNKKLTK